MTTPIYQLTADQRHQLIRRIQQYTRMACIDPDDNDAMAILNGLEPVSQDIGTANGISTPPGVPMNPIYIEVNAGVRYWEDATVNGTEDTDGVLIPMRKGDCWAPVIRLADGMVMDWPEGTQADIHYKVCDQGEYWLLNEAQKRVAKWKGYYVPNDFLVHGGNGYGDYIIFTVGGDGLIAGWKPPAVDIEQWSPVLE